MLGIAESVEYSTPVELDMSMGKISGAVRNEDYEGKGKSEGDKRELENVVDGVGKRRKLDDVVGERKTYAGGAPRQR